MWIVINGARVAGAVAVVAVVALTAPADTVAAAALPDPGPTCYASTVPPASSYPPLRRIGHQLVRGDNLTGASVPAPSWVPELGAESPV